MGTPVKSKAQASQYLDKIATQFAWVKAEAERKSENPIMSGNFWIYDPLTEPLMHPASVSKLDEDTLETKQYQTGVEIQ